MSRSANSPRFSGFVLDSPGVVVALVALGLLFPENL